jgi:hypothetical protein
MSNNPTKTPVLEVSVGSFSAEGTVYVVRRYADDTWDCTCKAYQYQKRTDGKHCKHTLSEGQRI